MSEVDVEEALVTVLSEHEGLTALIGATPPRLFHIKLAQGTALPAIAYRLVADVSENSHDGPSGLARARIQFDCWAKTKEEARAVSAELRHALVGIRRTVGAVVLQGAFKLTEQATFEPDVGLRRRVVDLAIWHSEAVA